MREVTNISIQDTSGKKGIFPCPECLKETEHSVLVSVNSRRFENDYVQYIENHLTVICDGCKTMSFSRISGCTEEVEINESGMPYLPRKKTHYPSINPAPLVTDDFVNPERIKVIRGLPNDKFDPIKLEQLLFELNHAYGTHSFYSCLMLIRAILDHVPPIFEKNKFGEIVNNYAGGGKSFRESMKRLDLTCRKIADGYLHLHIRETESVPTKTQVEFRADLDALLGEVIRIYPKL